MRQRSNRVRWEVYMPNELSEGLLKKLDEYNAIHPFAPLGKSEFIKMILMIYMASPNSYTASEAPINNINEGGV